LTLDIKNDNVTVLEDSMITSRPKWDDPEVKQSAVAVMIDSIRGWAEQTSAFTDLSSEEIKTNFCAVVTLAVQENADAYLAAKYLDTFMDWPADAELFRVLDSAYKVMHKEADKAVAAWVMKENVRFKPKETDFVKFKIGPVVMQGTVSAVIPNEARGIVSVSTGTQSTKYISVNAEDIISFTKVVTKPRGGNNPTGGTPVAARASAVLKEEKAA
jgi:hypothetical protein